MNKKLQSKEVDLDKMFTPDMAKAADMLAYAFLKEKGYDTSRCMQHDRKCGKKMYCHKSIAHELGLALGSGSCLDCGQYMHIIYNAETDTMTTEKWEDFVKSVEKKKEASLCDKLLEEESEDDYYIQAVDARQFMLFELKRKMAKLEKEETLNVERKRT